MKLCILGGGGFRTPFVHQALLRDEGSPRIDTVALHDTDAGRLAGMTKVLDELAAPYPDAPRLVPTTRLEEAVEGSDFVFAAVRVGGLHGRTCDERVALDLDVLGQETVGPGGLAYALRTVPVMMHVAETVKKLAPTAFVINFTNPAGIITEAMQQVLGDRVVGICDTPSGLGRRVAAAMGLDDSRVQMDYVGLNHLGWMHRVLYDGRDVLPDLLADDEKVGALEEGIIFGPDWLRTIGAVPNEYLYYYYRNRDAVRAIVDSGLTRGEFLAREQDAFYQRLRTAAAGTAAALWRQAVATRSDSYMAEAKGGTQGHPLHAAAPETDPSQQGYAGVAMAVMNAITRNERSTLILNVRNRGSVHGLPDDAVVELPATVDANGVHPLTPSQPSLHELGLMAQVKAVERHTIAAAVHRSRGEALQAFALHPLVGSLDIARQLVAAYIDRIPEVAAVLTETA